MKKFVCMVGLLAACENSDSGENKCVFDGTYEVGALSHTGCENVSETFTVHNSEEECSYSIEQFTSNGWASGYNSCEPGTPVVECDGFLNYDNGCGYTTYIRRVGK